jgi:hypothetical protein
MMFSHNEERLTTEVLDLRYHLTPWDIPIVGANVAAISSIRVHAEADAVRDYAGFATGVTNSTWFW